MSAQGWEHFAHGADIGVRGLGPSLEAAFAEAARALTAIVADPDAVRSREVVAISCQAPDDEILLVDWLNALLFEMATRHMLFGCFSVTIEGGHLAAEARGEPLDPARHSPAVEAKGATYTELRVAREADGIWIAQCVVDV
jgi:tRNA nucleotidyltransferase (CCA-adding enzyme)